MSVLPRHFWDKVRHIGNRVPDRASSADPGAGSWTSLLTLKTRRAWESVSFSSSPESRLADDLLSIRARSRRRIGTVRISSEVERVRQFSSGSRCGVETNQVPPSTSPHLKTRESKITSIGCRGIHPRLRHHQQARIEILLQRADPPASSLVSHPSTGSVGVESGSYILDSVEVLLILFRPQLS